MVTQKFRFFFFLTGYLSLYSGFLLLLFVGKPLDFYPTLRHGILKTHIAVVIFWLFACGMLFSVHVFPQLKAGITAGRKSGILLIGLLLLMSVSGYAIQIVPGIPAVDAARLLHIFFGVGFTALFVGHLYVVRPQLRTALAAITAASVLVLGPFIFLKADTSLPDEIQLKPTSTDAKKN